MPLSPLLVEAELRAMRRKNLSFKVNFESLIHFICG